MSRPGILRAGSSYGPTLDPCDTFNNACAKQNARHNSLSQLLPPNLPQTRPRGKSFSETSTAKAQEPRCRRVSFTSGCPPDIAPIKATQTAPAMYRTEHVTLPKPNPTRTKREFGSDPGPSVVQSWLHDTTSPPERVVHSAIAHDADPSPSVENLKRLVNMLTQFLPKDRVPREKPLATVRKLINFDALAADLQEDDEMADRIDDEGNDLRASLRSEVKQMLQVSLRRLYWMGFASVEVSNSETLRVPEYIFDLVEELASRDLTGAKDLFGVQPKSAAYWNLFDSLNFGYTPVHAHTPTPASACDPGQLFCIMKCLLEGLPEAPLHPCVFRSFYELCCLATLGDSSADISTVFERRRLGHGDSYLTPGELRRVQTARLLFCIMPNAHADALTYLLTFLAMVAAPAGPRPNGEPGKVRKPTAKQTAECFGFAVCGPRNVLECCKDLGYTQSNSGMGRHPDQKEWAKHKVSEASRDVLMWLICYWDEIRSWRPSNSSDPANVEALEVSATLTAKSKRWPWQRSASLGTAAFHTSSALRGASSRTPAAVASLHIPSVKRPAVKPTSTSHSNTVGTRSHQKEKPPNPSNEDNLAKQLEEKNNMIANLTARLDALETRLQ